MTGALALLAPLGFLLALLARPVFPIDPGREVRAKRPADAASNEDVIEDTVAVRWWRGAERGTLTVEVETLDGAAPPDLLVYRFEVEPDEELWIQPSGPLDELPADAVLLGPVGGEGPRRFTLPPSPNELPGIAVYSLAHRRPLGWTVLGPRDL